MIVGANLGYQEQGSAFTCSTVGADVLCRGSTTQATATIMELQRDLAALAKLGIVYVGEGQASGAPTMSVTVDGIVGPLTVRAVQFASRAARDKFDVAPSVPAAADGSHDGLSTAEMRVVLEMGTPQEIATWAREIAAFIRSVTSMETRWRASQRSSLVPGPIPPRVTTETRGNPAYLALAVGGIGLALVGGILALRGRKSR